jgi:hypothetical protein
LANGLLALGASRFCFEKAANKLANFSGCDKFTTDRPVPNVEGGGLRAFYFRPMQRLP